jgi:hypothetical protein
MDMRVGEYGILKVGGQFNDYDAWFGIVWGSANLVGTTNTATSQPTAWGATFTQGALNAGNLTRNTHYRRKTGRTFHLNSSYRHEGPIWKWDAGLAYSDATNHYTDTDEGYFVDFNAQVRNATIRFDNIDDTAPRRVIVTQGTQSLDWANLDHYTIQSAVSTPLDSSDRIKTAYYNVKRDFDVSFPLTVKTGFNVREMNRQWPAALQCRQRELRPQRRSLALRQRTTGRDRSLQGLRPLPGPSRILHVRRSRRDTGRRRQLARPHRASLVALSAVRRSVPEESALARRRRPL